MVIVDGGVASMILALTRRAVIAPASLLQEEVVLAGQTYTVRKTIGAPLSPVVSSGISITGPEYVNDAFVLTHSERLMTPKRRTCWVALFNVRSMAARGV